MMTIETMRKTLLSSLLGLSLTLFASGCTTPPVSAEENVAPPVTNATEPTPPAAKTQEPVAVVPEKTEPAKTEPVKSEPAKTENLAKTDAIKSPVAEEKIAPLANTKSLTDAILISLDGVDRSVLKELLVQQKLPAIAALIKEGSIQDITVKGHETCTKPGHAEMLTGLAAEVTGIFNNEKLCSIPEGYTIFERLEKHFGKKINTVFLAAKIGNLGGDEGGPYSLAKKKLDTFDVQQRTHAEIGPLAVKYTAALSDTKSPRHFLFVHFSDPDATGHKSGSASPEYRTAIIKCDEWIGKVVETLKKENLYDKTRIYVTTDHGFDKNSTSHTNAPDGWLVTNDTVVTKGGILADIAATILERFGVPVETLKPELLGKPLFDVAPAMKNKSRAADKVQGLSATPEKSKSPAVHGKSRDKTLKSTDKTDDKSSEKTTPTKSRKSTPAKSTDTKTDSKSDAEIKTAGTGI